MRKPIVEAPWGHVDARRVPAEPAQKGAIATGSGSPSPQPAVDRSWIKTSGHSKSIARLSLTSLIVDFDRSPIWLPIARAGRDTLFACELEPRDRHLGRTCLGSPRRSVRKLGGPSVGSGGIEHQP